MDRALNEEVIFDMGNRGAAAGIPPKRARIEGFLDVDGNIIDDNNPGIKEYYAISIRNNDGNYVSHKEGDEWIGIAPEFIKNIPEPQAGGKKNRKASRKNNKASRKNRKASRKNRKASRKNRK